MGNFTLSEKFVTEFDGDEIIYELERADIETMKSLAPFMEKQKEGSKISLGDELNAITIMGSVIPKFINFIRLPQLQHGGDVAQELIFTKQYFLPLLGEIFSNLMEISNLKVEDVKKSEDLSPTESTEDLTEPKHLSAV